MKKKGRRKPSHPGAILAGLYIEPLELSLTEVAKRLGVSRKTVSKIVNERGSVTAEMSLKLSKAFGTTAELWLNLQKKHDLYIAMQESDEWKGIEPFEVDEIEDLVA